MSRFSTIDLKDLPAPSVIEPVSFDAILAARMADAPLQAANIGANYTASTLDTDPIRIDQRVSALREIGLRQKYNDDVKGVLLAFSWGNNLDQVASDLSVKRLIITPADPTASPPTPAVYESDDALRERRRLAPEALSTAGPEGAYLYFAQSVVDANGVSLVKSVAVYGPHDRFATAPAGMRVVSAANALAEVMNGTQAAWLIDDGASAAPRRYRISPGCTHVVVLGATGDGTVNQAILDAVYAAVNSDSVRPIGDFVVVLAAKVQHYDIQAKLIVGGGADAELVRLQAVQRLTAYAASRHRVGKPVYHAALDATAIVTNAAGLPIAEQAIVSLPANDLDAGGWGAWYCDSVSVSVEVQHD
jgi:phage-related baseplate assembly protein